MKKRNALYTVARPLFVFFTKCFLTPKIIGVENIPKEGKVVLFNEVTYQDESAFHRKPIFV